MVLTSVTDASLRWFSTPPPWHVDAVGGRTSHHWRTMTFLAALRHDRVEAPWPMAPRRANQWRDVPPPRRHGPGPDPAARRHRRHGQSRLTQEQSRAARHQGGWRPPALPAQILARPEPHRTALLKAQALAPTGRCPNHRRRLQRSRPHPRDRHPRRMLTLLRPRRVRTIVHSSRSSERWPLYRIGAIRSFASMIPPSRARRYSACAFAQSPRIP